MLQAAITTIFLAKKQTNFIFSQVSWLLLGGIIFNFQTDSILAQTDVDQITINQNNVTKPMTVRGVSGGNIEALEITKTKNTATGYCDGFVRRQPNHLLNIDSFFSFLRLKVESQADTTILVQGPGGTWCNDDSGTANPMIEGQWQPGTYKVWVGSYQANSKNDYQIEITGRK